jgi:Mn-dependent DtxR family transcriptional regulator
VSDASSSDYFGTFLSTVQAKEDQPDTGSAPLEMIALIDEHGPMRINDLQAALHQDIMSFSKVLLTMSDAKLIELKGKPGEETVDLTEPGRRVAELGPEVT